MKFGGFKIELILIIIPFFIYFYFKKIKSQKKTPRFKKKKLEKTFEHFGTDAANVPITVKALKGKAYIIDGDSLVIKKTQVRLFGVDAPEINHPYGQKSKWALVSLCKGQIINAEVTEQDTHGRTVAKCYLPDGRDLSAEMVKLGLAIDWPKYSSGVYKNFEVPNVRKKLWLADARQKGRTHVWEKFEANQK